jgi:hypothetical protein
MRRLLITASLVLALLILAAPAVFARDADDGPGMRTYRVTIENLTHSQPFSPPVAATHQRSIRMFEVGRLASDELAAIAQGGDQVPMANRFRRSDKTTDVVDLGRPLTRKGTAVGSFTDSATFAIRAAPGDSFSIATMLICTNDGFLGLDAVRLPRHGTNVHWLNGYDAGRERNTEQSVDLVDPCSALGPALLPGDPDGNRDGPPVTTVPPQRIQHHPNIQGTGELSPQLHGWRDPVAKVTITRL